MQMNIYVPDELRAQMKQYSFHSAKGHRSINWSQIACDAFVNAMRKFDEYELRIKYGLCARRARLFDSHTD
jgi:hypothetical protein